VVEHSLRVRKFGSLNPGQVKSKIEKLTPVASPVNIHHLRARPGQVGPVTEWGYHVHLRHGTLHFSEQIGL